MRRLILKAPAGVLALGFALVLALGALPVWAQSVGRAANGNVSAPSASTPSALSQLFSGSLSFQDVSFVYGPSISDPSGMVGDSSWINQPSGMGIQNQMSLRYNFDDTFSLSPTFDFMLVMTDPTEQYKQDQYLALAYDSFISFAGAGLWQTKIGSHDLWFNSDVRWYVPSSDFSRQNGTIGSLRLSMSPYVQFAQSPFSFSWVNYVRYWMQSRKTVVYNDSITLPKLMLYTGPLVNYQVNQTFAVWTLLEASVTYDMFNTPNTQDSTRSLVDLEPGFDVHVGDRMTISPYVNWFTNQDLSTASMNLMAVFSI